MNIERGFLMHNLKNSYFIEAAESIKWNNIIFIKSPSFLQRDFIKFMSQKYTDISNINPLSKCFPGMKLEKHINFLLKWNNYKELKYTKRSIEEALSSTSQNKSFYVNLLLHPSRIILTTLQYDMLKDPSLYRILNLGISLMKKKYIIFVEEFVHENLKQYKLIDFSGIPKEKNTYSLKILEGISTKNENIIFFPAEKVIFLNQLILLYMHN